MAERFACEGATEAAVPRAAVMVVVVAAPAPLDPPTVPKSTDCAQEVCALAANATKANETICTRGFCEKGQAEFM